MSKNENPTIVDQIDDEDIQASIDWLVKCINRENAEQPDMYEDAQDSIDNLITMLQEVKASGRTIGAFVFLGSALPRDTGKKDENGEIIFDSQLIMKTNLTNMNIRPMSNLMMDLLEYMADQHKVCMCPVCEMRSKAYANNLDEADIPIGMSGLVQILQGLSRLKGEEDPMKEVLDLLNGEAGKSKKNLH